MAREYPQRLHHAVPAWVKGGSVFHVRLRTALDQVVPLTAPELAPQILKAVQRYHELAHWWCQLVVVMPDHLHALLSFPADAAMAAMISRF